MTWLPRGDLPGIFVLVLDAIPVAFVQVFPDGSAAYWFVPMSPATPAPSFEAACLAAEKRVGR